MSLEVDRDHGVPLLLGHVDEDAVAQDPGIVDEDVDRAERRDRGVDQTLGTLPVGDVVSVGDRLSALGADLSRDFLGGRHVGARTVVGGAEIIDHDLGAFRREQHSVLSPDPAARTGDDCDTSVESIHVIVLSIEPAPLPIRRNAP